MKRFILLFALVLMLGALAMVAGCVRGVDLNCETTTFEQTSDHAHFSLNAEMPWGTDKVSTAIREDLKRMIDDRLSRITSYEGERYFGPYEGDATDTGAFIDYYCDKAALVIMRLSDEDAAERAEYINADEELTDERKAEILADFPTWEYEFNLKKTEETSDYVVFDSIDYIYMGGAHGGMIGDGSLTYSKKDGHRVEAFLDPECVEDIQPLIRKGLAEYFAQEDTDVTPENLRDFLLIDDDVIPLPSWQPFPGKDGLVFTYQQYEVAPYAAGMPGFVLPYAEVEQFLTEDAAKMLRQ